MYIYDLIKKFSYFVPLDGVDFIKGEHLGIFFEYGICIEQDIR